MAEKKEQHIVPRCYLKHFVDQSVSSDNEHFTPGVFVNAKEIDNNWKMRGVNHRTFTSTRFYNLAADDNRKPIIEDYLSSIELKYDKAVTMLLATQPSEILPAFTNFIVHQIFRTKSMVNNIQSTFDKVASYADLFEGSNQNWNKFSEISKKMILNCGNNDATISIYKNAIIILNSTDIPFITSDRPVVQRCFNKYDVEDIFRKESANNYNASHFETPFIYMPVTPWLGYISHRSLRSNAKAIECSDLKVLTRLNDMMVKSADKNIYSINSNPINCHVPPSIEPNEIPNFWHAKIFTENHRLIYELNEHYHDKNSLVLSLKNTFKNNKLVIGQDIISVEVINPNNSGGIPESKMSECFLAEKGEKKLIIKSKLLPL